MLPVNILTKRFEQQVARDLWDDARTSFNQPTRRMKERKTHIEVPGVNGRGRKGLSFTGWGAAGGRGAAICVYSLRATAATVPLDAGKRIDAVREVLDHKRITTMREYAKRWRSVRDSASYKVSN